MSPAGSAFIEVSTVALASVPVTLACDPLSEIRSAKLSLIGRTSKATEIAFARAPRLSVAAARSHYLPAGALLKAVANGGSDTSVVIG